MGVPVVTCAGMRSSWNTPERMRTWSGSLRCVTYVDWPGLRRSRSAWMSASESGMPGGQPSTTHPIAGPWLSPKVVKRKRWPKVLCDIVLGLYDRNVRRVLGLHADHVIAGVDMHHFAGDAAREIGQQEHRGIADFSRRHGAAQGSVVLVPFQHVAKVANAGCGERPNRAGRDCIDADVLLAEVLGEVAHAGFKGGFRHAHDIVVRHHFFGAV